MKNLLLILLILAVFAGVAFGVSYNSRNPIKQANKLIKEGSYLKAKTILSEAKTKDRAISDSLNLVIDSILSYQKRKDSLRRAAVIRDRIEDAYSDLYLSNSHVKEGVFKEYYFYEDDVLDAPDYFKKTAAMANKYKDYEVDSLKILALSLLRNLPRAQAKALPKMRKHYGAYLNDQLWIEDIEVKTYGKYSKHIQFIGGPFFSNVNKDLFYKRYAESLYKLRFKKMSFLPYKGYKEYTYYDLYKETDSQLY